MGNGEQGNLQQPYFHHAPRDIYRRLPRDRRAEGGLGADTGIQSGRVLVVQPEELSENKLVAKDGQRRYWAEADDKDGEHRQEDSRHMKETANGTACGKMTVNDAEYTVLKLLGKGKGGYSYLVTTGEAQYVLKQIHHEPCEYYTFGDKLQAELHDYETLQKLGIPMPKLLAVDAPRERILKEYIAGATVAEQLKAGRMESGWLKQVRDMCALLYPAGLNIDYYPTNFVPRGGTLYYIDYECSAYMEQWDFEHWGIQYWAAQTPERTEEA